ncbi:MAG: GAF domain-containing protein [Nitrospinae bacterium]|nr:GAF domain-containing protein [Nitrospinota bacterium]
MRFIDQATADNWFNGQLKPVLNAEVTNNSNVFGKTWDTKNIQSECLIPIINRGSVCGAIALGASKPRHFHDGLRTDYLERMAEKLAIAIDNILLIDRLRLEHPTAAEEQRASA